MTLLERWGYSHIDRYLEKDSRLWSRLSLRQMNFTADIISFFIGFSDTLVIVLADITLFSDLDYLLSSYSLIGLLIFLNTVLVALEFWLLFHLGFYVVSRYIKIISCQHLSATSIPKEVVLSLVRAVLELNEPEIKRFGLNPYKAQKKHYWFSLILYKSKVILSNALGKLIARKLLARIGFRSYAPLIATLITGIWDAWIQHSVLQEVRFRIAGRLYVLLLLNEFEHHQPTSHLLEIIIRILAIRIESYGSYNVNLDFLLVRLVGITSTPIKQINKVFVLESLEEKLSTLNPIEKQICQQITVALIAFKSGKILPLEHELMALFDIDDSCLKEQKHNFNTLSVTLEKSLFHLKGI